jgi:hypothetical protein
VRRDAFNPLKLERERERERDRVLRKIDESRSKEEIVGEKRETNYFWAEKEHLFSPKVSRQCPLVL